MKKLILIGGDLAGGKSTFSNLLKDKYNYYVKVSIDESITLLNSNKEEFIKSIISFMDSKNKEYLKENFLDEFDEFMSLVLALNDENKELLEPFSKNLKDKLNYITKDI